MSEQKKYDAETLRDLAAKLAEMLKIRTLPIAMKRYKTLAEMEAIKGVRRPREGRRHTTCQLVTQSRVAGFTLGITADNLRPHSNCGGVIGLDQPSAETLDGTHMHGVWFENKESACAHQTHMTRAAYGEHKALVISPLRSARIDDPDIVLFYGTPGQTILFVNGLQWKRYKRYDMTITGESACSDSWGRALATGETSISIPCYAERRFGGVADDEMLLAMPPDEFARGIEGLQGLGKVGLRYPIPPWGSHADPSEGMAASYG